MTYERAMAMIEEKGFGQIPVYDAHCHIGGYGRQTIPKNGSAEMLVKMMERLKISAAFISSLPALTGNTYIGNKQTIEACAEYPGRIYGYLAFNPNDSREKDAFELEGLLGAPGVVGLKFHSTLHAAHPDDKRYIPAYELAMKYQLPILMHIWGAADVAALDKVCKEYPKIQIIAAHAGGIEWNDTAAACEAAKRYDNLYVDLCLSFVREGLIEYMTRVCSASKVLFGSDASFFCPIIGFGRVLFANISREEKEMILYKNTKNIFMEKIRP